MIRRPVAAAGLVLGFVLVVLLPASPAHAHAALSATDPSSGAVLPQAPGRITLTFTEPVQVVTGKIQVLAPDSSRADDGQAAAEGSTVTIGLRGQSQGTYLVSYRVISTDSHPIAGSFAFSIGQPSTTPAAAEDTVSASPAVRAAIATAKGLGYAGLLLIVGPVLVLALLWPGRLSRRGPGRLVWAGFGLVLVSTVAGLWLQVPYTLGGSLLDVSFEAFREVLSSKYGALMLVRLGAVAAGMFLVRPLLQEGRAETRADRAMLAVLGLAAVVTWPLSGHPAATPVAGVSVLVDAVHLSAMAVWLGGLVMLVGFILPRADDRELGAIMPIWSRWAASAVGALVLAGAVQAVIGLGAFSALVTTTYGRLLLAKIGLVLLVLAAAVLARRLVLRGPVGNRRRIRRTVAVELGVTVVILAITAVLVQTPPMRTAEAAAPGTAPSTRVDQTLRAANASLQVGVFPAQVGNNAVHLYAYTPDSKPLPVVEWTATAALTSAGIEPIAVPLLRITDNHAIGDIALPRAGTWKFTFTMRTTEIDRTTLDTTVTIR